MLQMSDRRLEGVDRRHIHDVVRRLRPESRKNLSGMSDAQIEAQMVSYLDKGPAWSIMVDDRCLAIGGVFILWPGVGEGWLFSTPDIERHKVFVAGSVNMAIEEAALAFGLHRLQMACRLSDRRACRFVEWLGFNAEGVMSRYGVDGSDFVRYAWVRNG